MLRHLHPGTFLQSCQEVASGAVALPLLWPRRTDAVERVLGSSGAGGDGCLVNGQGWLDMIGYLLMMVGFWLGPGSVWPILMTFYP